jgi:hypothetical protein
MAVYYKRSAILVLFGATFGAFLDYLHTHGEEIIYPPGTNHWRGILTFAFVYWFGATTFCMWNSWAKNPHHPKPYSVTIPHVLLYGLLYAITAYADWDSRLIAALLASVSLLQWRFLEGGSWQALVGAAVSGLCGAATESFLSHQGTMSYVVQDIAKVPYWLFFIYFNAACSYGEVCRRLLTVKNHMK